MSTLIGIAGRGAPRLHKEEQKELRQRSLRLLGSLLAPLQRRLILTALVVVISTGAAGHRAGDHRLRHRLRPARAAEGAGAAARPLRRRLPDRAASAPGVLIAAYTVQTARISQAMLIDLRERVFVQTQRLSLEFHEQYTSGRIISRQTSDLDSIRELLDGGINELVQSVLYMAVHRGRARAARRLERADPVLLVRAARVPDPLVPAARARRRSASPASPPRSSSCSSSRR